MAIVVNAEMIVGAILAAAVVGALAASSLFRNVALAVVAAAACVAYARHGLDGLYGLAAAAAVDLAARPDFGAGIGVGAVFIAVLLAAERLARRPT